MHRLSFLFVLLAPFLFGLNNQSYQWLSNQQYAEGSISAPEDLAHEVQGTSEAIFAFQETGATTVDISAAHRWFRQFREPNSEFIARFMLSGLATLDGETPLVELLLRHRNVDGGFGDAAGYPSSPFDTAWALRALSYSGADNTLVLPAIDYLVQTQSPSGGWSYESGQAGVFVTALVVQGMAGYSLVDADVSACLSRARLYLISQQGDDHLWGEDFMSALALNALSRISSDTAALMPALEALQQRRFSDGSWQGDVYTTALALQAISRIPSIGDNAYGTVMGQVFKAGSREPLAGVSISLLDDSGTRVTANAEGYFLISNLHEGSYTLVIDQTDFQPQLRGVEVIGLTLTDAGPIYLSPLNNDAFVSGRVFDDQTGAGVVDAQIIVNGPEGFTATTDHSGALALRGISPGTYDYTIAATGYHEVSHSFQIAPGSSLLLEQALLPLSAVLLDTPGRLTATIIDGNNRTPIVGAVLDLRNGMTGVGDALGQMTIDAVPRGNYVATLHAAGYGSRDLVINFPAGSRGALGTIALYGLSDEEPPSLMTLSATLVDSVNGLPIAQAEAFLDSSSLRAISDAHGKLSLFPIATTHFSVTFSAPGYQVKSVQVNASGFGDMAMVVPLEPGTDPNAASASVFGLVKDAETGVVIPNAEVIQVLGAQTTIADASGAYRLDEIASLEFSLEVRADGYSTQRHSITLPGYGAYPIDLSATRHKDEGFNIVAVQAPAAIVPEDNLFTATIENLLPDTQTVLITATIRNAADEAIASLSPYANGTQVLLANVPFGAAETKSLIFPWRPQQTPTGSYRLVVNVAEAGSVTTDRPQGIRLATGQTDFFVGETLAFAGALEMNPPMTVVGAASPVSLKALIRNEGNILSPPTTWRLRITDAATLSDIVSFPKNELGLFINETSTIDFGEWSPQSGGNYTISVTRDDLPGQVLMEASYYVGSQADATYTVTPTETFEGTQSIRAMIDFFGIDTAGAVVDDPLLSLVEESVTKASNFTIAETTNWQEQNRCLGCHVQTQAMVGLTLAQHKNAVNDTDTTFLYNALAGSLQDDGVIKTSTVGGPVSQTALSTWGLGSWPQPEQSMRSLTKAWAYLWGRKSTYQGDYYFRSDHNQGWWNSFEAMNGLVALGLGQVFETLETVDPNLLLDYEMGETFDLGMESPRNITSFDGKIYLAKTTGVIECFDPVTGQVTVVHTAADAALGQTLAIGKDGTFYLGGTQGRIDIIAPDGTRTSLSLGGGNIADLLSAEDGRLYVTVPGDNRILAVDADGQASVVAEGGLLQNPVGLAEMTDGTILVANRNGYNILALTPEGTLSVYASGFMYGPRYIHSMDDDHFAFTTVAGETAAAGVYLLRPDRTIERLLSDAQTYGVAGVGGRIYYSRTSDNQLGSVAELPLDLSIYDTIRADLPAFVDYTLARAGRDSEATLEIAHRLITLAEMKPYIQDAEVLSQIDNRIESMAIKLRSRQREDGGWTALKSEHRLYVDPLVTAWVGIALNYTEPSLDDPMVRNTIRFLLDKQQTNGSWDSWMMGTNQAATSMVMIYLPLLLPDEGGLDATFELSLPDNLTLSQPNMTPVNVQAENGGTTYHWSLENLQTARLEFDLNATDLVMGEHRAAGDSAKLFFTNSFTDEVLSRDVTIPVIQVLNPFQLSLTTDKTQYTADEDVLLQGMITNSGSAFQVGALHLGLRTPGSDTFVATLEPLPFAVNGNDVTSYQTTWHTGQTQAATYEIVGILRDASGNAVAEATTPLSILVTSDGPASSIRLTSDRLQYEPWDQVNLTARIFNHTRNLLMPSGLAIWTVTTPNGVSLLHDTFVVNQLTAESFQDIRRLISLADAEAGAYTTTIQLYDATGNQLKAQAQATFEVVRSPLDGLTGTVTLSARSVEKGAVLIREDEVTNLSSHISNGATLARRVIDMTTGLLVMENTIPLSLAGNAQWRQTMQVETGALEAERYYTCILNAVYGEETIALGAQSFYLETPPIAIEGTFTVGTGGRVLVLADSEDSNPKGWGDADPFGPEDAPLLSEQKTWLEAFFERNSISATFADNEDDFLIAFHDGSYAAYLVLSEHIQLSQDTLHELREAVFRGESLLYAGPHDNRLNDLVHPAGVTLAGEKIEPSEVLTLAEGTAFTAQDLTPAYLDSFLAVVGGSADQAGFTTGRNDTHLTTITTHVFGLGRAIYMGIDIAGQATAAGNGNGNGWDMLLMETMQWLLPEDRIMMPGSTLPFRVALRNQGTAVNARVILVLPEDTGIIDAPQWMPQEDRTFHWTVNLAETEMQAAGFLIQVPIHCEVSAVEQLVSATIQYYDGTQWVDDASLMIDHTVEAFPALEETVAQLHTLWQEHGGHFKQAHKEMENTESRWQKGQWDKAYDSLLKAAAILQKIEELQEAGVTARSLVGRHLRQLGMNAFCH